MMNAPKRLSKQAQTMQAALYQANGSGSHLQTLIDANILMAYKVARKHIRNGLDFEDLVSEAVTGIIKAASRYDATKGASFTTFARQWMISQCQDFVRSNCGTVRVTSRVGNLLHSKPINAEGSTVATFVASEDLLQDERMERTEDSAAIGASIQSFVDGLKARDKEIFIKRIAGEVFGQDSVTAVELADKHGLTKQRVCQIEKELKNKLRSHFSKDLGNIINS